MNVFDLDQALVNDYERFARSFTLIRAPDIQQQVEELYANDRFWPEPLVSINPRIERGDAIDRLVANGTLHSATGNIFSIDGKLHQMPVGEPRLGLIWFLRGPSRHGNLQSAPGSSLTIRMRARDEREARDLADGVSSPLTSAQLKTFPKLAAAMGAQWAIVAGEVVSRTVFCPGHSDSAHQGQL